MIHGGKGADFYTSNPLFWAKMAAFTGVALLSILPTLRIAGWSRRARADASFAVGRGEAASLRQWFAAELALFATIPVLAALMARGVGL